MFSEIKREQFVSKPHKPIGGIVWKAFRERMAGRRILATTGLGTMGDIRSGWAGCGGPILLRVAILLTAALVAVCFGRAFPNRRLGGKRCQFLAGATRAYALETGL